LELQELELRELELREPLTRLASLATLSAPRRG
jgi:hypothetical protein